VIRERLEEYASGWDAVEEADDVRAVDEIAARISRGEERLRDWAEVEAVAKRLIGEIPSDRGGYQ